MTTDNSTPTKLTVLVATPPGSASMGSFGKAEYMLLKQHNFPYEYDEAKGDKRYFAYSDRLSQWDSGHTDNAHKRRPKPHTFLDFAQHGTRASIMAFLIDVMKAEEHYPGVKWTGFRITGSVNISNGYPVYTYELFSKGEGSDTKVYSRSNAPNCHPLGHRSTPEQRAAYTGPTFSEREDFFGYFGYSKAEPR